MPPPVLIADANFRSLSASIVMLRLIAGVKRGRHWHPVVRLGHQSTTKPSDVVSMITTVCHRLPIQLATGENIPGTQSVGCRLLPSLRGDFWPLIGK
jgi:hypothetical protein